MAFSSFSEKRGLVYFPRLALHSKTCDTDFQFQFLSSFLVKKLIALHSNHIDVQLITTDTIEHFYGDRERNIHELIRQEVHIEGEARRTKNKWKTIAKVLGGLSIVLFLGFAILNYWLKDIRLLWLLIPLLFFNWVAGYYRKKSKRKRVCTYWYNQLFPF